MDATELSLNPSLLKFFPLFKRTPHNKTKAEILSESIKFLEYGRIGLQNFLIVVVFHSQLFKLLKFCILFLEYLEHLKHV